MLKRISAGLLLSAGLTLGTASLLAGPAMADTSGGATGVSSTVDPYATTTQPTTTPTSVIVTPTTAVVPASSSTTDPCLTGNGTTGTTNPGCAGVTQPSNGSTSPAASTQAATSPSTSPSSGLAFTGADVVGTVIIGGALIGGGAVVVGLSRRRRSDH